MEARTAQALRETLDQLRLEVAELRASRERLVASADADRRKLERVLHDGVQQHLIALAVNLQLAGQLADADSAAAKAVIEEMARDVQQALDEAAQLARQMYPPLLEAGGGLVSALRAAAVSAGTSASVEVTADAKYRPEIAGTVYFCCLEALEHAGPGAHASVTVRDDDGALTFDVTAGAEPAADHPAARLDQLRDRVEALGGSLSIGPGPDGTIRMSGSLPLSR